MKSTKVAFVSSKSRGLSPDLRAVKDYLFENLESVSFSYFTGNENSKNKYVKQGVKNANKEFCKNIENAICIDGSLPAKLVPAAEKGKRILISTPYDYQFKAMNGVLKGENKKKNTFSNFTNVIVGSPFGRDLFEKCYKIPKGEIIDKVCCPLAWKLNSEEQQKNMREKFQNYFPDIEGKKILSILFTGSLDTEENPFENFDWKALIKSLGDQWFIFTNNEDFIENAIRLGAKYRKSFGYVNQMLDSRELMYFSDCIVTNSGMYASYFSSRKKPVYCMKYNDNEFEKYMRNNYSGLFINDLNGIIDKQIQKENYSDEHRKFSEYFSYDTSINPCDTILEILTAQE